MAVLVLSSSLLEVGIRLRGRGQERKKEVTVLVGKCRAFLLRERNFILRKDDGFADAQFVFADFEVDPVFCTRERAVSVKG